MFEAALPKRSRELLTDLNGELTRMEFYLAGGTGLALQLGHRVSEDLDFFTEREFDAATLSRHLASRPGYTEMSVEHGTLHAGMAGVKLSFLHYIVPLTNPLLSFRSVLVADWRDILTEKLKTLSQRGSRRDFYDIYACLVGQRLSVAEAIGLLKLRFGATGLNYYHVLKSLEWFNDAEAEPEPVLLQPMDWQTVKSFFTGHIREFEAALLAIP
jgi:hypothetical protein